MSGSLAVRLGLGGTLAATSCDNDDSGSSSGHGSVSRGGWRSRDFVNFAAVPDGPDPASEEKGSGDHLEEANHEGATVPAAALVAVGLQHSADTG